MACITTTMFFLRLKGDLFGFFESERGLRQGDPMSPLLFVFVMEYLSRILKVAIEQKGFMFHPGCKELKLFSLSFADDPLLFYKAEVESVKSLLTAVNQFADCIRFEVNPTKTEMLIAGTKQEIM